MRKIKTTKSKEEFYFRIIECGINEKEVFNVIAYSKPNGTAPSDLGDRIKEVTSILATIKFY